MRYMPLAAFIFLTGSALSAQDAQLRTFDGDDILTTLRSGELVDADKSAVQMLGYARLSADGSGVEISGNCRRWDLVAAADIVTMQETLVAPQSCGNQRVPYVKLTLENGAAAPDTVVAYSLKRVGGSGFQRPNLMSGGLAVSDLVWDSCVDTYLECQIEECAGSGQWCQDMCEYEFDFCTSDR